MKPLYTWPSLWLLTQERLAAAVEELVVELVTLLERIVVEITVLDPAAVEVTVLDIADELAEDELAAAELMLAAE